ncbi:hypothetical protein [Hydrocarboniphaga effusa]|uniref:hypothetical protein n=1 Tax=Hydrocarboniphaga effusa TaxID=243629 RepID=UPI00398BCD89
MERFNAITLHAEAEGREELAAFLARETAFSIEQAIDLLAHAPRAVDPWASVIVEFGGKA